MTKSCQTCLYWEEGADHGGREAYRNGRCRRYPPNPSLWPVTLPGDWCGEHAPRGEELTQGTETLSQDAYEVVHEDEIAARH
jgi:hypothetical protein